MIVSSAAFCCCFCCCCCCVCHRQLSSFCHTSKFCIIIAVFFFFFLVFAGYTIRAARKTSSPLSDGNSSVLDEGDSESQVTVELAGYGSVVWPDSLSEWLVDDEDEINDPGRMVLLGSSLSQVSVLNLLDEAGLQ